MSPLLSAGQTATIRRRMNQALGHTYTRTPMTVVSDDGWSSQNDTPGSPVTGLACRYREDSQLTVTPDGRVVTQEPGGSGRARPAATLTVAYNDSLKEGDQVSNVQDSGGTVLLAGPARVQAVLSQAGFGPTTLKLCVLRGDAVERETTQ